ncbi:MAG: ACP phosphodiesterase [Bacteroidota bacterium]|nr:ACP phosphodiesterase [Bacteroidota bacterium]
MNYLAHAFLSNNDDNLLIGNFIADHLRGNNFKNYPTEIINGIYLHRKIDSFTDNHLSFKASKRLFYGNYERYSGILIDIYFDYFLAKKFTKYSNTSLKEFCEIVYTTYSNNQHYLPQSSSRFLEYVIKNNIYSAYSSLEGIEKVLFHLSHRIQHGVMLNESISIFKEHELALESNFDLLFNDAVNEFIR